MREIIEEGKQVCWKWTLFNILSAQMNNVVKLLSRQAGVVTNSSPNVSVICCDTCGGDYETTLYETTECVDLYPSLLPLFLLFSYLYPSNCFTLLRVIAFTCFLKLTSILLGSSLD